MMDHLPPIILASASPRRTELLARMGLHFAVMPGHTEELEPEHLTPVEAAEINAYLKARQIAKREPDALVIGADTIVALGTRLFGKPRDLRHAAEMLAALQGHTHQVITGVCLIHLRRHRQRLFAVSTRVKFRPLLPVDISRYLAAIQPLDKAGAYAIQDHGDRIVESIEGSYDNVVGLPTEQLRAELARWQA